MQISVVIVSYNVLHFLQLCLESVQRALLLTSGEIIVVDNQSTDGTCAMVKRYFPDIKLIENQENVGFSKANNQGVQAAAGKYVLILNPDTIIAENTLQKILKFAENHYEMGALGVKMIDGSGNYLPESKRNLPTPIVSLKKLLGKTKSYYAEQIAKDQNGKVPILTGAFMFLEKEKYLLVGGFDEDYFMYGEDIDLSYKLTQKGYVNYYFSDTSIIHYKGESTIKNEKYLKNFYGAMHIFYQKHFAVNPFYDFVMRLSIDFWMLFKKLTLTSPKTANSKKYNNILYIGSDNKTLQNIQNHFISAKIHVFVQCTSRVVSAFDDLEKLKSLISDNATELIIFDPQHTDFTKIIYWMQELSEKGIDYLMYSKSQNLLLGSHNKEFKGEIIQL